MAMRAGRTVNAILKQRDNADQLQEQLLTSLLEAADANGDGCVDFNEFRTAVKATDPRISEREIKKLFSIADKDGDG